MVGNMHLQERVLGPKEWGKTSQGLDPVISEGQCQSQGSH